MMEYTIDYIKTTNTVIHCKTAREAMQVVMIMYANGIKWMDSNEWDTNFGRWNSETCYSITLNHISYTNREWCNRYGYTIIPASTFIQDNTPRLYTEDEVLEREQKAFGAARVGRGYIEEWDYKFNGFDDYKKTLNPK